MNSMSFAGMRWEDKLRPSSQLCFIFSLLKIRSKVFVLAINRHLVWPLKHLGMHIFIYLIVFMSFTCHQQLMGQVDLKIQTDTSVVEVGKKTSLVLTCSHDPEAVFRMPQYIFLWHDSLDIEITASSKWDTVSKSPLIRLEKSMSIMPFDLGSVELGPLKIPYIYNGITDTAVSNIAHVSVVTKIEEQENILDIKDIERVEPLHPIWWIGLGLLIVIVLVLLARRFIRKKPKVDNVYETHIEKAIDPLEDALLSIDVLRRQISTSPLQPKQFHTEISRILKLFLERIFVVNLVNKSTTETINVLNSKLNIAELTEVRTLLTESDMVKFARRDSMLDGQYSVTEQLSTFVKAVYQEYYTDDIQTKTDPNNE